MQVCVGGGGSEWRNFEYIFIATHNSLSITAFHIKCFLHEWGESLPLLPLVAPTPPPCALYILIENFCCCVPHKTEVLQFTLMIVEGGSALLRFIPISLHSPIWPVQEFRRLDLCSLKLFNCRSKAIIFVKKKTWFTISPLSRLLRVLW